MNLPFRNIFSDQTAKKQDAPAILSYEFLPVPVHLYIEKRRNSRISLLKTKANVRLPKYLTKAQRQTELDKLLNWAAKHIEKKGLYPSGQFGTNYLEEGEFRIADHHWKLEFIQVDGTGRVRAKLNDEAFTIQFTGDFNRGSKINTVPVIRTLMIKLLNKYYLETIKQRVSAINDKTLQFSYEKVRLKYMKSRWGSCSSKKNINLSLRLLLLPDEVRDYVILHELAHLKEMNHSTRFWNLVEAHDKDYKTHERWLKKNGHLFDI